LSLFGFVKSARLVKLVVGAIANPGNPSNSTNVINFATNCSSSRP